MKNEVRKPKNNEINKPEKVYDNGSIEVMIMDQLKDIFCLIYKRHHIVYTLCNSWLNPAKSTARIQAMYAITIAFIPKRKPC